VIVVDASSIAKVVLQRALNAIKMVIGAAP
jgi:hypothetical protein